MKKFILIVGGLLGGLLVSKKIKDQQAEQSLWEEATAKSAE